MADLEKILIVICDGLGDRPVKEFKGKTPLQVAKKPAMNKLANNGICGMMYPIDVGVRAGSDTSHLAILGYDPYKLYTGRGPYEAAGVGLEVRGGDVAFRCNFSTVDENLVVRDRRAGRIKERTEELAKALDGMEIEGVKVLF
ncbi:MAG: phosphoglycerate mutase, partial [Thermoplasmata archaeon]